MGPRFSFVTVLAASLDLRALERLAASVLAQSVPDWEWLLVVDPGEPAAMTAVRAVLDDERVRVVSAVRGSLRAGLEGAQGEHVVPLPVGVELTADALESLAGAPGFPHVDLIYGDEDLVTVSGRETRRVRYSRPGWSPERLRHGQYVGDVVALRRAAVAAVAGSESVVETGLPDVELLDLLLRLSEAPVAVAHVGSLLTRRSGAADVAELLEDAVSSWGVPVGPQTWEAGRRVVQQHLDRAGVVAEAVLGAAPGQFHLRRRPDLVTPVSVVIPTMGAGGRVRGESRSMVVEAVRSLASTTEHLDVEFVVVYDTSTPVSVLDALRRIREDLGTRVRLVEFARPFNFSTKCNVGALHATGEVLVFANDDLEAITPGTIEQLVTPLAEPGVGMTGPLLLFETRQIQHAGLVYGGGTIAHSYYRQPDTAGDGVLGELRINREVSALTGACIAVRREVFEEVGGFCEALPVNYNDVDLSLKIRATGRRLLWLHDVALFHFESVSRSNVVHDWEKAFITGRWGDYTRVPEMLSNRVAMAARERRAQVPER